jgi:hypothetical protein
MHHKLLAKPKFLVPLVLVLWLVVALPLSVSRADVVNPPADNGACGNQSSWSKGVWGMNATPAHLTLVDKTNACYNVVGTLVWGEWWRDTNNDSYGCKTTDKATAYTTCADEDMNWYLRLDGNPASMGVTPTQINLLQRWSQCKAGYTDPLKWCNFLTETIPSGGNFGLWWDTQANPSPTSDPSKDWDPTNDQPQLPNPCLDKDWGGTIDRTKVSPCKGSNLHIAYTGSRVMDNNHGWMEIHPVRKEVWADSSSSSKCYYVTDANQASSSTCQDTAPSYSQPAPASPYSQVLDNADPERFFINSNGNWPTGSNPQAYSPEHTYRYHSPTKSGYYAYYKVDVPTTGTYKVYAWWPASSSNNSSTAFWIWTTNGWVKKPMDQRTNGGQWVDLGGTYQMPAGDDWDIEVDYGYYSAKTGYIVADAVWIERQ